MKRILAVDLGNSSISIGLFDGNEIVAKERLKTLLSGTVREYRDKFDGLIKVFGIERLGGVIISSVVPELTETLSTALSEVTSIKPLVLGLDIDSGLSFDVLKPEEVGPDRIANVVGAAMLYGAPAIAVDFGTATTFSIIRDNTFIGGTIMPGLEMMARALNAYTSRLPLVDLTVIDEKIDLPGKDTMENIISGIIYGTAGAVERIIGEIESRGESPFNVVLTGGFSVIMARFIRRVFFLDPDLTLKGLRFIYERKDNA
ncbi:MAG: type III pantothenate kinase [Thermodesulfovibrionales bacterium]